MSRVLRHADYTVAWIAILPIEVEAALGVLDSRHIGHFEVSRSDDYTYIGGEINGHNVVIAKLPAGQNYGVGAAAALITHVKARFENIWFALLVGVAAGLPNVKASDVHRRRDIRLGDVLVCIPDKTSTGIVQYDLGSDTGQDFEMNGRHAEPPGLVRSVIGDIQLIKRPFYQGNQLALLLEEFVRSIGNDIFHYPGQDQDELFESHVNDAASCDAKVQREPRDDAERTRVWYGKIGSGSTLLRNAERRDELRDRYDLIGLEMEAAGIMNTVPTGVVRGVCDYGDSHKTKQWQPYAAAVAAVYAKAILLGIKPKSASSFDSGPNDTPRSQPLRFGYDLTAAPVIEDDLFIGRSTELQSMHTFLRPQEHHEKHRRLVIGGFGGIGKTQLAIAYVKRHCHSYDSVFWLNSVSEAVLKQSIHRMAQRIFEPGRYQKLSNDDDQILHHVLSWLLANDNTQWLLIYDNYDEPDAYEFQKYCPYAAHGSVIITTRLPDQVMGYKFLLQPLTIIEQSLDVLATRSRRIEAKHDIHALALAKRMQGLPLALATAGAFLSKSTWTFQRYLQVYEERWKIHSRRPLQLQDYQDRTLYTTWNISYHRLEKEDSVAAQLLKVLAYFHNQHIWFELLQSGVGQDTPSWLTEITADPIEFEDVMRVLVDYCFVDLQTTKRSFGIHNCIHDWLLADLGQNIEQCSYRFAFDCVANSIEDVGLHELGYTQYAQLVPHAKHLLHPRFQAVHSNTSSDQLLKALSIAQLLQQQVELDAAISIVSQVLEETESMFGREHVSTLSTVHKLAGLYARQWKLVEAEQLYVRALTGRAKVLDPDHISLLATVHELGNIYKIQGNLVKAEKLYLRALEGKKSTLEPNHVSILNTVHALASLNADQGKLAEAEHLYLQVIAGQEKALVPNHILTLDALNNLGYLYTGHGKMVEAEQFLLRALDGYEQTLGREHVQTLEGVSSLSHLFGLQGRLAEAESLCQRALAGFEKALNAEHPTRLDEMLQHGDIRLRKGEIEKAKEMYQQIIDVCSKSHTDTTLRFHPVGRIYAYALSKTICLSGNDKATFPLLICLIELFQSWNKSSIILAQCVIQVLVRRKDDTIIHQFLSCIVPQTWSQCLDLGGTQCKSCYQRLNTDTGINICRECIEMDLCDQCLSMRRTNVLSASVCEHDQFYDLGQSLRQALKSPDFRTSAEADDWLDQLKQQYKTSSD